MKDLAKLGLTFNTVKQEQIGYGAMEMLFLPYFFMYMGCKRADSHFDVKLDIRGT